MTAMIWYDKCLLANNAVVYSAKHTKRIKNKVQKNCLFSLNKYECTIDQELTGAAA